MIERDREIYTQTEVTKDMKTCLEERLLYPKAVLVQLRDSELFNYMIDQAIEDIDYLLAHCCDHPTRDRVLSQGEALD